VNTQLFRPLLAMLAANLALFFAGRVLFLGHFAAGTPWPEAARVYGAGLRMDLALFGYELPLLGLVLLAGRTIRPCRLVLGLWALTGVHVFIGVANAVAWAERGQNAGELLLPYITSPWEVCLAVLPFVREHWLTMGALAIGFGFYAWLGVRVSRRYSAEKNDLWRSKQLLAGTAAFAFVPVLFLMQPVTGKKFSQGVERTGRGTRVIESKYFTRFSEPACNQAVLNPLFEFVRVQVPAQRTNRSRTGYRLSEAEALAAWREAGGRAPTNARFPWLTAIHGPPQSGIENIIVIQVEGLSRSILDQERQGRAVTPFLRRMAREGWYFSNTLQNVNFTSGGVFSTLASVPKLTFEEASHRFAGFEMNGSYASLAHVLGGSNYTHYFCEGFRQSWDDFMAFAAHQGCEPHGYGDFKRILEGKNRLMEAESLLGIHDGEFLEECAELFLHCPTHFTAHCMTCTTHSPWAVPAGFTGGFEDPALNAFAYFDASLRAFCERLQSVPAVWDKTLLVVIGDHTSAVYGTDALERLRIPLIFYGPKLPVPTTRAGEWASQVDVVPTVLGLLPGEHRYAGLGRNLQDATWPETGIVSGTIFDGLFVKDGFLLRYTPGSGEVRMQAVTNGPAEKGDLAGQQPELARRLRREYFAQIELAKRLALGKRIFPLSSEARAGMSP
jgi:hypothetical protein